MTDDGTQTCQFLDVRTPEVKVGNFEKAHARVQKAPKAQSYQRAFIACFVRTRAWGSNKLQNDLKQ